MILFVNNNAGLLFIRKIIKRIKDSFGSITIIAVNRISVIESIYARLVGDSGITKGKIIDSSEIVQTDVIIKPEVVQGTRVKPTISIDTVSPKIENIDDIDIVPDAITKVDDGDDSDVVLAQPPMDVKIIEGRHEDDSSITEIIKPDTPTIEGK